MTRTAIKLGIFVVVCLFITLQLAFTIGNIKLTDPLGRDNFSLKARFNDVTGLLVNDNVKIAGVVVGKVTDISVEKGLAQVTFNVSSDYQDELASDTRAEIRWRNLIGQRYLYLFPGEASTTLEGGDTVCPSDDVCENKSAVDLGELFDDLGPIVDALDPADVNEFLDTFTKALDGREDEVGQILDDLAVLTAGLGERDQTIAQLVTNLDAVTRTINSRDEQIATMLDNLVVISEAFSANTDTLDEAITELGQFSRDLGFILDDNAAEIDRLLGNLADVTDVVGGRLDVLDTALSNLDEAAAKIFVSSSKGEFLTQSILCATLRPLGPDPAVCDLIAVTDATSSSSSAAATASPSGAEPTSGADGILDLLGGGGR